MTKIKIEDYKGKNITYTLNPEDEINILTTTEDDELGEETGLEVLKKIKEKTTSPIIILLNKNNEFLSKHYLDDGFKDFIIKEELEQQIKKCNKYL